MGLIVLCVASIAWCGWQLSLGLRGRPMMAHGWSGGRPKMVDRESSPGSHTFYVVFYAALVLVFAGLGIKQFLES